MRRSVAAAPPPLVAPPKHKPVTSGILINLLGQCLPIVVGIALMPIIVRTLGPARFGVLALAWAVAGYIALFDFGVGRSSTRFIAHALGHASEHKIPSILVTGLASQSALGLLGGLAVLPLLSYLVSDVLRIPSELQSEATLTFAVLALSTPILLVSQLLRGALEASRRFGASNAIRVPIQVCYFFIPAIGSTIGLSLPTMILLFTGVHALGIVASSAICIRLYPDVTRRARVDISTLRTLLGFGGWIAISSAAMAVMLNVDRFIIGSRISVGAVAYYAAPFEMAMRMLVIPIAVVTTLFPAMSALAGPQVAHSRLLAKRGMQFTAAFGGVAAAAVLFLAPQLLRWWLGEDYAAQSTDSLRILVLGIFLSSLAHIPFTELQAVGRPDIAAKINLVELPIHVYLAWALVARLGIEGAAVAWSVRGAVDLILQYAAVKWLRKRQSAQTELENLGSRLQTTSVTEKTKTCDLCGMVGTVLFASLPDRAFGTNGATTMYTCTGCQLVWRGNTSSDDLYGNYYTHQQPRAKTRRDALKEFVLSANDPSLSGIGGFVAAFLSRIRVLQESANRYAAWLGPGKGKRVLDVGCGNGELLVRMRRLGWEVTGIDPDPRAVSAARQGYELDVQLGTSSNCSLPSGSFDAVTLVHVIEHVADPTALLRECGRLVKPDGVIVVVTPNVASLGRSLFGRNWRGWEPPRHLTLFGPNHLERCASLSGLKVQKVFTTAQASRNYFTASYGLARGRAMTNGQAANVGPLLKVMSLGFWLLEHVLVRWRPCGEEVVLIAEPFARSTNHIRWADQDRAIPSGIPVSHIDR